VATTWFVAVAALWTGYFVLEGFDFGVGLLLPLLGRDDRQRRVLINTIGPVWDGNEVWAITAVGATFAAFPHWYASLLSGSYLLFLPILAALIVRGVAFEYRGKRDDPRWKARWDTAIVAGSLLPALLWGVVLAGMVRDGVPYALLGAATTLSLFATHGAVFLTLKTTGEMRARAGRLAARLGPAAAALTAAFLAWTVAPGAHPAAVGLAAAAALTVAAAALTLAAAVPAAAARRRVPGADGPSARREGWAFAGTAAAIALTVATLFTAMDSLGGLSIGEAAASPYTLRVLSWSALLVGPFVLLYQGWSYWVFRRRIDLRDIPR
jgi:cytochrome bd ubiquinol oxidase subunit II